MNLHKLKWLWYADLKQTANYFKDQTVAKAVTVVATVSGLAGLSALVFYISKRYFEAFQIYEPYGLLTSRYLLHAGLVVAGWLVLISSLFTIFNTLASKSRQTTFMLYQPDMAESYGLWIFLRSSLITSLLLGLLWVPALTAFSQVYSSLTTLSSIVIAIFLTVVTGTLLQSLGAVISSYLTPLLFRTKALFATATGVVLILGTIGLVQFVLPNALGKLLRIDISLFETQYAQLPLNNPLFPTGQAVQFFETGNSLQLVPLVALSLGVILISANIFVQRILFVSKKIAATEAKHVSWQVPSTFWFNYPVMTKELLGVLRVQSERNALLFFIGLYAFFFFFLQRAFVINPELVTYSQTLLQFSLGAVLFITIAAFLRLVFPLLSREGSGGWLQLREPNAIAKFQGSKHGIASLLAITLLSISYVGWSSLPIDLLSTTSIILLHSIGLIFIASSSSSLGLLVRDWHHGDQPDIVSTSLIGLLSLSLSLLAVAGSIWFLSQVQLNQIQLYVATAVLSGIFFPIVVLLYKLAQNESSNYRFSG